MTIEAIAQTTADIAGDFAGLCRAGRFDQAGEDYWADAVISLEPAGEGATTRGIAAVRAKGEQWAHDHEIHGVDVGGPWVNGDRFALRFRMDITPRATGRRMQLDEFAVYTVKAGKIVEERFFYGD